MAREARPTPNNLLPPGLVLLDLFYTAQARLAPERARRWRAWKQHVAGAGRRVDHAPWQHLLERYVARADRCNGFAYGRVSGEDRRALDAYVLALQAVPVSALDRSEQFAFWCNLYNAVTVQVVLDHHPLRSMRGLGVLPYWVAGGPWTPKRVSVEDWRLSLNDIEHRILRRNWRDRRIHYALNCGARGCPDLQPRAFEAPTLNAALDAAERAYVNDPRGVHFVGNRLVVSSLFVWYQADFVPPGETLVDYLRRHAAPELAARLAGRTRFDAHAYDWTLNEAR